MITSRRVRKYLLPLSDCAKLQEDILRYLPAYEEAPGVAVNHVASLYLDTAAFDLYRKSVLDPDGRALIRLRRYNASGPLYAEMKQRHEGRSIKRRVPLPETTAPSETWRTIETQGRAGRLPDTAAYQSLLRACADVVDLDALQPSLLVRYRRVAYQQPSRPDVRLTLDTHVTSAGASGWVLGRRFTAYRFPSAILEVKLQGEEPSWLSSLTERPGLTELAGFCKYVHGLALVRTDARQSAPLPGWLKPLLAGSRPRPLGSAAPASR